jgi:hypothetical protein
MSPKKKIFLNLGIFLGIFLVFLVWIFPNLFGEIQKISQDLIFLKQKLLVLQKEEENLQHLKITYQNYEANLQQIQQIFVNYKVPIEFIEFLEKAAHINQQEIDISLYSPKVEEDLWPSLTFRVLTKGPFSGLMRFLAKLENSPYLIEILNLNIKTSKKDTRTFPFGEVEGNFLIKTFVQNEEI